MSETMRGAAGTAERFPKVEPKTPAQAASLARWLIEAPGQSPAWRHYLLSIIHLRPMLGAPPAHIRRPGATHELILCALDSERGPRVDDIETICYLTPLNALVQFTATDEVAIHVGELAARAICDGYMPAEPAFPGQGQRDWEQAVDNTIEHHRTGRHPECCGGPQ